MLNFSLGYVRNWGKCYQPADCFDQKCQRKPRQDGKDRRRINTGDPCLVMPEPEFWTNNGHPDIYVPVGGKKDRYIHLHCVCRKTWQKVADFIFTSEGEVNSARLPGFGALSAWDREYVKAQIEGS